MRAFNTGRMLTLGQAPDGPTQGTPASLLFDEATPEQIGIHCPLLRQVAAGTVAALEYKASASSVWLQAHPLIQIVASDVGQLAVVDAFAGTIFDLLPGLLYDVRVTISEPSQAPVVLLGQRATRALPPTAGAPNKTATTADNLQSKLDGLVPGDVLQLASGTYNVNGLYLNTSGTQFQPIYIRGASRSGVVIKDTTGTVLQWRNASWVVLENLTIEGSSVDSGVDSTSAGIVPTLSPAPAVAEYVTIRQVTFRGVDRGIVSFSRLVGWLVYHCDLIGNNAWDRSYTPNPAHAQSYPNWTWNDDGIRLPGDGNCAWNNTLNGFGDSFATAVSPSYPVVCRAVHYYRNKITSTGDDAWEADYGHRNISFYDNYIANSGTLFSADPVYGGPAYCFRNISINAWRGPFKWNSDNSGMLVYNNTIIKTGNTFLGVPGWGWNQSNNGFQRRWSYRNNLLYKADPSPNANVLDWGPGDMSPLDFTHNGWFPDGTFTWANTGGSFASLAAAQAGLPTRPTFLGGGQRHASDLVMASGVFSGSWQIANYQTEWTSSALPTLAAGVNVRNSGLAIPGITDGFSGAAPDRGAIISGRTAVVYGDPTTATPVIQLGGTNNQDWTPNEAAGAIVETDWAQLPANKWHRVLGTGRRMRDIMESPELPTNSGVSPNFAAQMSAWCGAANNYTLKELWWGANGGHGDGHQCDNAWMKLPGSTLRFVRVKDRSPLTDTHGWDSAADSGAGLFVDYGTNPFYTGAPSLWPNLPKPVKGGRAPGLHSYYGQVYLPPAAMQAAGYTGNINGGLLILSALRQIQNWDDGTFSVPHWEGNTDHQLRQIVEQFGFEHNGVGYMLIDGYRIARFLLTGTTDTKWSQLFPAGGLSKGSYTHAWATVTAGLASGKGWSGFEGLFVQAREAGCVYYIHPTASRRIRYAEAISAGATDWNPYVDALTISGPDAGDFTVAQMQDTGSAHLARAGTVYDHAGSRLLTQSDAAGGALYAITGLGGSALTITKVAGATAIAADAKHSYNRLALWEMASGVKVIVRTTGVDNYPEVLRLS